MWLNWHEGRMILFCSFIIQHDHYRVWPCWRRPFSVCQWMVTCYTMLSFIFVYISSPLIYSTSYIVCSYLISLHSRIASVMTDWSMCGYDSLHIWLIPLFWMKAWMILLWHGHLPSLPVLDSGTRNCSFGGIILSACWICSSLWTMTWPLLYLPPVPWTYLDYMYLALWQTNGPGEHSRHDPPDQLMMSPRPWTMNIYSAEKRAVMPPGRDSIQRNDSFSDQIIVNRRK